MEELTSHLLYFKPQKSTHQNIYGSMNAGDIIDSYTESSVKIAQMEKDALR